MSNLDLSKVTIWGVVASFTTLAVLMMSSIEQAHAASQSSSTLTQQIRLIDCTETSTSTGGGTSTSADCAGVIAPTVDPYVGTDPTPTISGTFDATTMQSLSVTINGKTYTYGQSPELSVEGNRWRLDLSGSSKLNPGTYNVSVEVVTVNFQLVRDTSTNEVVIKPMNPIEQIFAPDTGLRRVIQYTVFVCGFATLVVLLLLIFIKKRSTK